VAPSTWREWSQRELALAADHGEIAINQIVYGEVAVGFRARERLNRALEGVGIVRLTLPWAACWGAAQAFLEYRRRGGMRATPLPDFFIGAHAAASGSPLLTRDPSRVSTYFPEVELIAP
jgi:predicted nucleic acid-binding protein